MDVFSNSNHKPKGLFSNMISKGKELFSNLWSEFKTVAKGLFSKLCKRPLYAGVLFALVVGSIVSTFIFEMLLFIGIWSFLVWFMLATVEMFQFDQIIKTQYSEFDNSGDVIDGVIVAEVK